MRIFESALNSISNLTAAIQISSVIFSTTPGHSTSEKDVAVGVATIMQRMDALRSVIIGFYEERYNKNISASCPCMF